MPGEDQSPALVERWVRSFVTKGAIMILRRRLLQIAEYTLVEVDFQASSSAFLYADGFGVFEVGGVHAPPDTSTDRLLIPTSELVEWAIGQESWSSGRPVNFKRAYNFRADVMRLKLREQAVMTDGFEMT
jgi:hypothetical protein